MNADDVIDVEALDGETTGEPGTDVEVAGPALPEVVTRTGLMPSPAEWGNILGVATALSRSNLVRPALRGKANDIALVLLFGRDLGLRPTVALTRINVIEGVPALSAEMMVALVRREGHKISSPDPVTLEHGATVVGERGDTGEKMSVQWTLDDAVAAGLLTIKDGKPYARSSGGKKLPWEQYPKAMLWARGVSQLCRMLFPDVLSGLSYTGEELGAVVDEHGEILDVDSWDVPPSERGRGHASGISDTDREAVIAALDTISNERVIANKSATHRSVAKHKFMQQFGHPDALAADMLPAVRAWIEAAGGTFAGTADTPTVAGPPPTPAESPPTLVADAHGEDRPAPAIPPEAGPPAPGTGAGDAGDGREAQPNPQGVVAPPVPAVTPSSKGQRAYIGMRCAELGIDKPDKELLVLLLTRDRTSTTTETTEAEAAAISAALRHLASGHLAFEDGMLDGVVQRGIAAKDPIGEAFLAPYVVLEGEKEQ